MSKINNKEVVNYQIERARATFEEIEVLLANKLYSNAVNRLYYACYYAVSALLIANNISAKSHKGSIQMFSLHFIESGIIDKESGKFYKKIFELRQDADYEYYCVFEEPYVRVLIEPTHKLISQIEGMLLKE